MMPADRHGDGRAAALLYSRAMAASEDRIRLADRMLAELVRQREEADGHPTDAPDAEARARAAGGSLERRVILRARHLPDSAGLRQGMRRALRLGLLTAAALAALFALAGAAAARAALQGSDPVSLPLALLLVVGPSLALLLLWLMALILVRGTPPGLPALLNALVRRFSADKQSPATAALKLLLLGPAGRWVTSSVMHLSWLAYTGAALLTLLLLLSLRSYSLSWETTLLDPAALRAWAEALSVAPALLGLAGAETLPLRAPMPDAASEAWAAWLLAAAMAYGLLPRVLALASSTGLAVRALHRGTRALHRPGYARLQARLMPEHGEARVVAAAPEATPTPAPTEAPPALPEAPLHVVAVEMPQMQEPLPSGWRWLGQVDDTESRQTVLARMTTEPIAGLAIIVRAAATADRGSTRLLETLRDAAAAPTVLMLAGRAADSRLRDWHDLAGRLQLATHRWAPGHTLRESWEHR